MIRDTYCLRTRHRQCAVLGGGHADKPSLSENRHRLPLGVGGRCVGLGEAARAGGADSPRGLLGGLRGLHPAAGSLSSQSRGLAKSHRNLQDAWDTSEIFC